MQGGLRRIRSGVMGPQGGESTGWRPRISLLLVSLLLLAGACTGQRIHVEVEATPVDSFSSYATYCWWRKPLPAREPPSAEEILDWRVRNAVETELQGRGYRETPRQPCDFIVGYTAKTSTRRVDTFTEFADYRARGGEGGLQDVLGGYPEGTLALHLFDGSTRKLLWRASASAVADPSKQKERVAEAVRRMLKDLPHRAP